MATTWCEQSTSLFLSQLSHASFMKLHWRLHYLVACMFPCSRQQHEACSKSTWEP